MTYDADVLRYARALVRDHGADAVYMAELDMHHAFERGMPTPRWCGRKSSMRSTG